MDGCILGLEDVNVWNNTFTGSADSEMSEEQKKEKLSELRKKEREIQDILAKKTKELKKICLREAVRNHFALLYISYALVLYFAKHIYLYTHPQSVC